MLTVEETGLQKYIERCREYVAVRVRWQFQPVKFELKQ